MVIESLDVQREELGQGVGDIVTLTGTPFAASPTRTSGFSTTPTTVGNADGYDVSSGDGVRLFYDVTIGTATFLRIRLACVAVNIGAGKKPTTAGANPDFTNRVLMAPDATGPVNAGDPAINITANQRGSILIPRAGPAIKFQVESDNASAAIALAAQNQHGNE